MSYLVLHIDVDFIVGAVCTDNGTSYPITNGKEELLWLYFSNNPHQNSITFGKDNKKHFNNSEVNYYGNFFEKIEKEQETFTLRGIEHAVIDLLKESGLLETIQKTYLQKADSTNSIPALITFSSSIGDNAKQKTVDYLKKQGFQIESYTIPLAELTVYHALNHQVSRIANGSVAIFLEATNSTLHLIKLSLSDNYFLKNGRAISYEGKGFDPRKQALLRFVVNEANKAIGALSSEKEKIEECKRLEIKSDEWLKKLDATSPNMPCNIQGISFSKMPNAKKDVLVRKADLENDTGSYIQELKDIFDAFRSDNADGDVVAVFLLGDCFKSDRVRSSFEQIIGKEKLYFYANKDIREISTMHPKIDLNIHTIEQNRKEARKLFEKAVELEKAGKLEDAKVNAENAVSLDKTNRVYKQFLSDLVEKIKILNEKKRLYKSYLNKAEELLKNGELEKALEEYNNARFIFDNPDIRQRIDKIKCLIKDKKRKEEEIRKLLDNAESLILKNLLTEAEKIYNQVLYLDELNSEAKARLKAINLRKLAPPPPPPPSKKPINEKPKTPIPPIPVKKETKQQVSIDESKGKNIVLPPPVASPRKPKNAGSVPPPPPKKK